MKNQFKKHLSIPGLLETSRKAFSKVSERDLSSKYSLVDWYDWVLMEWYDWGAK